MSDMIATESLESAVAVASHEISFLDVLGLYPQTNRETGRSFLSVSGVTPDNHSGSFNINAPVDVVSDETAEWVDGLKQKLQSEYLDSGLRRVKISGGVWKHDISKEDGSPVYRQNGEACGSIRPASRAEKMTVDFKSAEPIPSSTEILY